MKSLLCLLLISASTITANAASQTKGSAGGRFQVVQISAARRDQILIDTQTGKMWRYTCYVSGGNDCAYSAWATERIEGITHSDKQLSVEASEIEKMIKERRPPSSQVEN